MAESKSKASVKRRRIIVSLEAPKAKGVTLMGDFNRWNPKTHPMKRDKDGLWKKIVMLPPGKYEYKFLVDGQWWHDPNNDHLKTNCFGTQNNVLVVAGT